MNPKFDANITVASHAEKNNLSSNMSCFFNFEAVVTFASESNPTFKSFNKHPVRMKEEYIPIFTKCIPIFYYINTKLCSKA